MSSGQPPGGFVPPSLPSPAPSSASSILSYRPLPHPRSSGPLRPGSRPETSLITFLDEQLLQVSRRYAKKFNDGGYSDVIDIANDLERLVDVLWVSSTPTLQTHYLLQIANSFNDYISSFPPQLKPTLELIDKLDRCFYSLVTGSAVDTPTPLSPPLAVYRMNMTERVRVRSVIERTRLHVIKLAGGERAAPDPPTESAPDFGDGRDGGDGADATTTGDSGDEDPEDENENLEMELSRVYERSLVEIGESLKREG